jgi:predicted phosphodiesterase
MYSILTFISLIYSNLFITQAKPEQVHITQGLTPQTIIISWLDIIGSNPVVKLNEKIYIGSILNYTIESYTSKQINHVQIDNLMYLTRYFYQIDTFTSSFVTGPEPGYPMDNLVFGIIGDIGQTADTEKTLQHLSQNKEINMILHAGDLSYADCNQDLWDSYGQMIEPLSSKIPWMVGPGNHEIEYIDGSQLYLSFESRYRMPQIKPAEFGTIQIPNSINPNTGLPYCCPSTFLSEYNYGNSFYSFDIAQAHIIFLNPYTNTDVNSVQYKWLEIDLMNISRKKFPWIIIVTHCPFYNSNKAHQNEKQTILMKESMESLFYKYKVNLIISGHVHAYERTFPVYMNNVNKYAPTYIVIGDGGNIEGHALEYIEPKPTWSAYRNGTQYGYGTLKIINEKYIQWEWFRNIDKTFKSSDKILISNLI